MWIPSPHIKNSAGELGEDAYNPIAGRQRQENPWGLLVSQSSQSMSCGFREKEREEDTQDQFLASTHVYSVGQMCVCARACAHIHTHTQGGGRGRNRDKHRKLTHKRNNSNVHQR